MKKNQDVKPIEKVDENVQKEKLVRKLISGNKNKVDDYQNHMISNSRNHDIIISYFVYTSIEASTIKNSGNGMGFKLYLEKEVRQSLVGSW